MAARNAEWALSEEAEGAMTSPDDVNARPDGAADIGPSASALVQADVARVGAADL